eukprot:c51761_g1_i1 orf=54-209(+)
MYTSTMYASLKKHNQKASKPYKFLEKISGPQIICQVLFHQHCKHLVSHDKI